MWFKICSTSPNHLMNAKISSTVNFWFSASFGIFYHTKSLSIPKMPREFIIHNCCLAIHWNKEPKSMFLWWITKIPTRFLFFLFFKREYEMDIPLFTCRIHHISKLYTNLKQGNELEFFEQWIQCRLFFFYAWNHEKSSRINPLSLFSSTTQRFFISIKNKYHKNDCDKTFLPRNVINLLYLAKNSTKKRRMWCWFVY